MDNNEEIEQRGEHLGREDIRLDLNKCFAFLWDVLLKPFLSTELITLIPVQVLSGFRAGGQTYELDRNVLKIIPNRQCLLGLLKS